MPGKDTELENDQVISFILWKLEIVYQCNGDSQLIKLRDQTVYRDWGSLEISDLLKQFHSQKKRGFIICPRYGKGCTFHCKETISRLVYNSNNKGFVPTENNFLKIH